MTEKTVKQGIDQASDSMSYWLRRSHRLKKEPYRFIFNKQHSYLVVKCYLRKINHILMTLRGHQYHI